MKNFTVFYGDNSCTHFGFADSYDTLRIQTQGSLKANQLNKRKFRHIAFSTKKGL